jgi:hypothetical protein
MMPQLNVLEKLELTLYGKQYDWIEEERSLAHLIDKCSAITSLEEFNISFRKFQYNNRTSYKLFVLPLLEELPETVEIIRYQGNKHSFTVRPRSDEQETGGDLSDNTNDYSSDIDDDDSDSDDDDGDVDFYHEDEDDGNPCCIS